MESFRDYLGERRAQQISKEDYEKGFENLDRRFKSGSQLDWGGKGFLIDMIAKDLGVSKKNAGIIHAEWVKDRK